MPRTCTICAHKERSAIDAALVAGGALRDKASRFGVGYQSLQRHKEAHIPAAVAKSQEAREEARALNVVLQLKAINAASLEILTTARNANDPDTSLKAIDRIHRQIELQAKLLGDLDERPQINLVLTPEWVTLRTTLIAALAPYPEARVAAAQALLAAEGAAMPLLGDAALALDPVAFAMAVGITPDPWQAQLLHSTAPRILLNVTRQGGKSSTIGLLAAQEGSRNA